MGASDLLFGMLCALGMTLTALYLRMNPFRLYAFAGVALGIRNNLGQVKAAVRQMSATATDNFAATLQMDTQESKRASGGGVSSGHGITVNQYIYSKSQTAADLMQEARYQAEMAVMLGV